MTNQIFSENKFQAQFKLYVLLFFACYCKIFFFKLFWKVLNKPNVMKYSYVGAVKIVIWLR